jgi:hypothetical protein
VRLAEPTENKMTTAQQKFALCQTVQRFLPYKITGNLRRIYLDFDLEAGRLLLTAVYAQRPTELELELFDDIVTNSNAHVPDFYIDQTVKLTQDLNPAQVPECVVFATYE